MYDIYDLLYTVLLIGLCLLIWFSPSWVGSIIITVNFLMACYLTTSMLMKQMETIISLAEAQAARFMTNKIMKKLEETGYVEKSSTEKH